jgi:hypothetical protein
MAISGFSDLKQSNIVENWLFDFHNQFGANLYFSFTDTTYNNNFYHGVIKNNPNIRESIDLKKSISKTNNISISIPDFKYRGTNISEELFGGSNYYINRTVKVYSKINDDTPVVIGVFRLINMETNGNDIVLSLVSQRPWDFISFPQVKHPEHNVFEPVVYGDFTPSSNANTANRAYAVHGSVFPVPVLYSSTDKIYSLMPRAYSASDNAFIHKYIGFNQFLPLRLAKNAFTASSNRVDSVTKQTIDNSGLNILGSRILYNDGSNAYGAEFEGYIMTAPSDKEISVTTFSNQQKMFQFNVSNGIDYNNGATHFFSGIDTAYALMTTPKTDFSLEYIDGALIWVKLSKSGGGSIVPPQVFNIDFLSNQFDSITDELVNPDQQRAYDHSTSTGSAYGGISTGVIEFNEPASNSKAQLDGCMGADELLLKVVSVSHVGSIDKTMSIVGLQLYYRQTIPIIFDATIPISNKYIEDSGFLYKKTNDADTEEKAKEQDLEKIMGEKYYYCGANGLQASWSGTPDITEIHEAHRDLLIRYAGMGTSDPNGWSDLNSAKDWKIRYWQLEPVELKKELEKLQYEGGFIFRYKNGDTSEPQYIFIKDSYSSADHNITREDLKDVKIVPDGYDSLLSKMDINYQKHPAEDGHIFRSSASNSTTRTNYGIDSKENIVEVNLDAYSSPEIPTSPTANPNDNFYSYYDNIYGDIKINISGTVINPKFYQIDIGDTVSFSDMHPEKAFGKSFTNIIFMITSLSRSRGVLKFEAREIA